MFATPADAGDLDNLAWRDPDRRIVNRVSDHRSGGRGVRGRGSLAGFITAPPSSKLERAGLGPAMWGSVRICVVCAFTALPLGVGTAVFLGEYKPTNRSVRMLHGFQSCACSTRSSS
jgi:hypothetical protein